MGDTGKTALVIAAVAAAALFAWAFVKSREPGATGGVWGTIGGLWGGASSLTQDVTSKSVKAGETLGGGVKDAANGVIGIANNALHVGGKLNPANWW